VIAERRRRRNERVAEQLPRYGPVGSLIPGSRYVRWYCTSCGDAMRVPAAPWPPAIRDCEVCGGRHGQVAAARSGPLDEVSGYLANAIRTLEDG